MIRKDYQSLPVAMWTAEEALHHTNETFDDACKQFPEIMEPYVVMLVDAPDHERQSIMRSGLRNTINQRYPRDHGTTTQIQRQA